MRGDFFSARAVEQVGCALGLGPVCEGSGDGLGAVWVASGRRSRAIWVNARTGARTGRQGRGAEAQSRMSAGIGWCRSEDRPDPPGQWNATGGLVIPSPSLCKYHACQICDLLRGRPRRGTRGRGPSPVGSQNGSRHPEGAPFAWERRCDGSASDHCASERGHGSWRSLRVPRMRTFAPRSGPQLRHGLTQPTSTG